MPDTGTACHGFTRWLLLRRLPARPEIHLPYTVTNSWFTGKADGGTPLQPEYLPEALIDFVHERLRQLADRFVEVVAVYSDHGRHIGD